MYMKRIKRIEVGVSASVTSAALIITLLSMVGCSSESQPESSADSQLQGGDSVTEQAIPSLPEQPFNYAVIELPQHYRVNTFAAGAQLQRAAIELDNTPVDNPITDHGATLGRVLFYDRRLSANGSIACASCHQSDHGFSDANRLSEGFDGEDTRRHSMGLANAVFYQSGKFFWDERAETLEAQVLMPFQDPVEMGLSLEELNQRVMAQSYYGPLFERAFGDAQVTSERIAKALAQFIRAMVSISAKYDQARVEVDNAAQDFPGFTAQENLGKRLFFLPRQLADGQSTNCAGCHISEAFVGAASMPLRGTTSATNNGLDIDSSVDHGVFESSGNTNDQGKFKVPSLKNVGVTPPYMHDGRFATIEEVVEHYSTAIQPHPNLSPILRAANGEPVRFNFTDAEKAALVAFLHTLTDYNMMADEKFSDPFQ